jgi:hypothetical protein
MRLSGETLEVEAPIQKDMKATLQQLNKIVANKSR